MILRVHIVIRFQNQKVLQGLNGGSKSIFVILISSIILNFSGIYKSFLISTLSVLSESVFLYIFII